MCLFNEFLPRAVIVEVNGRFLMRPVTRGQQVSCAVGETKTSTAVARSDKAQHEFPLVAREFPKVLVIVSNEDGKLFVAPPGR